MTTKITASRFRIRPAEPVTVPPAAPLAAVRHMPDDNMFTPADDGFGPGIFPTATPKPGGAPETEIDAIRREGLTGRQLRLARRMAQMHGLPATSDFDAIRLLRAQGIDPFQRNAVMEVVQAEPLRADTPPSRALTAKPDTVQLPQTIKPIQVPSTEMRAETSHAADILAMQRDLMRRRRRKSMLLAVRLFCFVMLPTLLAGYYYYMVATPLYESKSEFVIQTADGTLSAGMTGGLGGMLGGALEANTDSIAVQGYLQSREALQRLNDDQNFKGIFEGESIDPIQRLAADATEEDAYRIYQRNIHIAYDPTERIVKMTVRAPDPQTSVKFSEALLGYAEEQIDHLTTRKREDQMRDARASYEDAESKMTAAQKQVVDLQKKYAVLSSEVEVGLISGQIGQLETQLSQDRLSLAQMQANANPNAARMEPVKRRIAAVEAEIATLRSRMTQDGGDGVSLAEVQSELLLAQSNVATRQMMLATTLGQLETARIEANRQVRYLSLSVKPVAQDEAAYPKAFENTLVAMLVFAGVYLMIAMTTAILREQVSS
jgi:capsular polysaccharide transport system permease protein